MTAIPVAWIALTMVATIAFIGFFEAMMRPIPRAHIAGGVAVLLIGLTIDTSRHALFYAALAARAAVVEALGG